VIASYTAAPRNFVTIVFSYYADGKLLYAGRTRSGFTPASRDQLFRRFGTQAVEVCPFGNLPEAKGGRLVRRADSREAMQVAKTHLLRMA
jgi:hypothetical protein